MTRKRSRPGIRGDQGRHRRKRLWPWPKAYRHGTMVKKSGATGVVTSRDDGEREWRAFAYIVAPGFPCPGLLRVTHEGLEFLAHPGVWLLGGVGGTRDALLPSECIASVTTTGVWRGMVRGWPGRLLCIRTNYGSEFLFGVSESAAWRSRLTVSDSQATCVELAASVRAQRRAFRLDCIGSLAGLGVWLATATVVGDRVGYPLLAVLLTGRYFIRGRTLWKSTARR